MKRWIVAILFLLVMGCYHNPHVLNYEDVFLNGREKVVVPEIVNLNVYWEWTEIQVKMESLHVHKDWEVTAKILKSGMGDGPDEMSVRNPFCAGDFLKEGERIYLKDSSVAAECLYSLQSRNHYQNKRFEFILGYFFKRKGCLVIRDREFQLLYYGDPLLVTEGNFIRHEKLDSLEYIQYKKDMSCGMSHSSTSLGIPLEIVFPLDAPVYSLTVITHPQDLVDYKPLNIDTSLLPIESPGYRKLREYGY